MGNGTSKAEKDAAGGLIIGRLPGVGEGTRKHAPARLPPNATKTEPEDWPRIEVINGSYTHGRRIQLWFNDCTCRGLILLRSHVGLLGEAAAI